MKKRWMRVEFPRILFMINKGQVLEVTSSFIITTILAIVFKFQKAGQITTQSETWCHAICLNPIVEGPEFDNSEWLNSQPAGYNWMYTVTYISLGLIAMSQLSLSRLSCIHPISQLSNKALANRKSYFAKPEQDTL